MSKLTDERLLPTATACMAAMVGNPSILSPDGPYRWNYCNCNAAALAKEAVLQATHLLAAVDEQRLKEASHDA